MMERAVLVVDGDRKLRAAVRKILREAGYRVFEAATGLEALVICACRPIDLMLTELALSGIGGIQLAEAVRERFPSVRILGMSADPPSSPAGPIMECLKKPVDSAELLARVRQRLAVPPKKRAATASPSVRWSERQG